jgi:hypothetical protein
MTALALYRDDGPLARALGRAGLPALAGLVAAIVPLAVALAADASDGALAACAAWAVLAAGATSGARGGRLAWVVPPGLRALEYAGLLGLAAAAGSAAAGFALLSAIAFRHYDLHYRRRLRGADPPRWVGLVGGGWDGRLLVAAALLLVGAPPGVFFALAGLLAAAFAGEAAAGWIGFARTGHRVADVEDDEGLAWFSPPARASGCGR